MGMMGRRIVTMARILLCGVSATCLTPGSAFAGEANTAAPEDGTAGKNDMQGLDEIVVTAQRRSESLQRAAIAITAVTSDELTRTGIVDTAGLTNVAPSLQISNIGGPVNNFYLRGVGNFVSNNLSDPAIAVNIDGVYIGRPGAVQGMFFDLQRVEVLKGPQGTLYGRNATGGAINIISTKPVLGEFSGYANFELGNYDARKVNGAINLPLGEKAALRVAGQVVDRDGTYSDGTGDDKQQSVRAQLSVELSDTVRTTIGADYAHQGGLGAGATVKGLDPDDRIGLSDPRAQAVYASSFDFLAGDTLHPLSRDVYNRNNYWGLYLQADIDTSLGQLTILPAYRRSSIDYRTTATGFYSPYIEKTDQNSLEVRLASKEGARLAYIFGLYGFSERSSGDAVISFQYINNYFKSRTKTDSYAAYGRLTYSITDQFRLSGGLRYTIDDKSARINQINATVVCPGVFVPAPAGPQFCFGGPILPNTYGSEAMFFTPGGTIIPVQPFGAGDIVTAAQSAVDASKVFRKLTYRVGAELDVSRASMLYASYETGYKSGGFFVTIDDPSFKPETISAITIGSKNRFFGNRVQLNIEAFRWDYKNQQVSLFHTNSVGGVDFVTQNVGKSRLQGIEVEGQARIFAGTTLNATAQYLDAKNRQFVYSSAAAAGAPTTGCPVSGPVSGNYIVDCSGKRPSQAPEWTYQFGIEQRLPLGNLGSLTLNADTRYQSSVYTGTELLDKQKGYWMSNLQLSWSSPDERFSVAGFVNNIENKNVVGFSQPNPAVSSLVATSLRLPRMYGVRVGASF
ncbi:TonB-dependent receptor domain-containing protein [Sphingobium sp.]|uniref:TonB-dependent receptor n=1 Tax=Sphingobium sp. TaxID=1912891 RepID=UPI0028BDCD8D|nr:TonB-dependent receptor [Sphingobium sp.]